MGYFSLKKKKLVERYKKMKIVTTTVYSVSLEFGSRMRIYRRSEKVALYQIIILKTIMWFLHVRQNNRGCMTLVKEKYFLSWKWHGCHKEPQPLVSIYQLVTRSLMFLELVCCEAILLWSHIYPCFGIIILVSMVLPVDLLLPLLLLELLHVSTIVMKIVSMVSVVSMKAWNLRQITTNTRSKMKVLHMARVLTDMVWLASIILLRAKQ